MSAFFSDCRREETFSVMAIWVGLGSAGLGWYKRLRQNGYLAAVVEIDASTRHFTVHSRN